MAKEQTANDSAGSILSTVRHAVVRAALVVVATMSATFFLEPFWPLGSWKWLSLFLTCLALLLLDWWYPKYQRLSGRRRALALTVVAFGAVCFLWLAPRMFPGVSSEVEPEAEVEFLLRNSARPIFYLINSSEVVARQPGYGMFLTILRASEAAEGTTHSLKIPARSRPGDFIHPGRSLGPWALESVSSDWREPEEGDVILGFAKVACFNCRETNVYWIEIPAGEEPRVWRIAPSQEVQAEKLCLMILQSSNPLEVWYLNRAEILGQIAAE